MKIELYTQQEIDFLKKLLELFEIEYTETEASEPFKHSVFELKVNESTRILVMSCMKYNYEKTFR